MHLKQLYFYKNKCYLIIRQLPHHNICDGKGEVIPTVFKAWKEYLGADHVLKTNEHFIFCETVQDVDWEDVKVEMPELEEAENAPE